MNPEQSIADVFAPESIPRLGPFGFPPPHEYGVPICDAPRRITYSMAAGPRTLPGATPAASAGASPKLDKNFRPRSTVACVAWAVAASDALAMASGSPGAPELISLGSVGSHWPASGSAAAGVARPNSKATADTNSTNADRPRECLERNLILFITIR